MPELSPSEGGRQDWERLAGAWPGWGVAQRRRAL